jgi:hypothetical protein
MAVPSSAQVGSVFNRLGSQSCGVELEAGEFVPEGDPLSPPQLLGDGVAYGGRAALEEAQQEGKALMRKILDVSAGKVRRHVHCLLHRDACEHMLVTSTGSEIFS